MQEPAADAFLLDGTRAIPKTVFGSPVGQKGRIVCRGFTPLVCARLLRVNTFSAELMKRSRAKSRDDTMALMHVTYVGEDALPLQQDTMRENLGRGCCWAVSMLFVVLLLTCHV